MDIKYNEIKGCFADTKTDECVTQAELLQWAAENPMPIEETPDSTEIEEGVETITDRG